MENWGLSVFVEQKILLDAEVASSSYQMEVTMVVVHEICHQVGGVQPVAFTPCDSELVGGDRRPSTKVDHM